MSFVIVNSKFLESEKNRYLIEEEDGACYLTNLDECTKFDSCEEAIELIELLKDNNIPEADKLIFGLCVDHISKEEEEKFLKKYASRAADFILNSDSFNLTQSVLIGLVNLRDDYKNKAYTDEEYIRLVNQEIDRYING